MAAVPYLALSPHSHTLYEFLYHLKLNVVKCSALACGIRHGEMACRSCRMFVVAALVTARAA